MGVLSGVLASMGLGGGFVLLVYLILFTDGKQLSSQGQNLVFFIPVVAVSLIIHIKNKLVDFKTALIGGLIGVAFVAAGFFTARALEPDVLKRIFACFIIVAGARDLFMKNKQKN